MKILQINKLYYPWVGGVETTTRNIAEAFFDLGIKVDVLVCQPKGVTSVDLINNIKVIRAGSFGIFLGMPISIDFFKEYKTLQKMQYDQIILHYPFPLAFIAEYIFPSKKPITIFYHSDIVRQKIFGWFLRPIDYKILDRAKTIIVSNPNMIKNSRILQKFKNKCIVIPHPIPPYKNSISVKNDMKALYGDFILSVGRLVYYKGFEYLIVAMQKIEQNLVIIGEGPLEDKLKNLIKYYNLEKKVFIVPHVESLTPYFISAKIFVLPSVERSETYGIVLAEALSFGLPLVSTEIGTGTSFINQDGVTGIVIPPKDPDALTRAIKSILADNNFYNITSQNAKSRSRLFEISYFIKTLGEQMGLF